MAPVGTSIPETDEDGEVIEPVAPIAPNNGRVPKIKIDITAD